MMMLLHAKTEHGMCMMHTTQCSTVIANTVFSSMVRLGIVSLQTSSKVDRDAS